MDYAENKKQYSYDYPMPACTADLALISHEDGLQVLLIRRGRPPFEGMWALPGGFAEQNETIEQTAVRELYEETQVDGVTPFCIGVFSRPGRDPRGWVISALFAAQVDKKPDARASDDAADARWFNVEYSCVGGTVTLKLHNGGTVLRAKINLSAAKTPFGEEISTHTLECDGIAFDHAEMLCRTLYKLSTAKKGDAL